MRQKKKKLLELMYINILIEFFGVVKKLEQIESIELWLLLLKMRLWHVAKFRASDLQFR